MRKAPNVKAEQYRMHHIPGSSECAGTNAGAFGVPSKTALYLTQLNVIVGDGGGWDHVSVSVHGQKRCPTWEEMCQIKELFFRDDEWVMQLHPPKSENISYHPFTLHMWRPQTEEERLRALKSYGSTPGLPDVTYGAIPIPPAIMVGPRE